MSTAFNEFFGWLWIGVGVAAGGVLGLRFHRDDWLGGYGSWARRLVRLGHIAMIGLAGINILFALSAPRVALGEPWKQIAAWSLLLGAVLMPAGCFLAAWRKQLKGVLAVPAFLVSLGVTLVWIGLLRRALGPL